MNQVAVLQGGELIEVLRNSLYPGAASESIQMVIGYCQAAGLDPMQKPVHIVPIYDSKQKMMRDVVMPGIGLYRIQASRSGEYAGVSEPEFGPEVTKNLGGTEMVYPEWCRVTVKRAMKSGVICEFTANERWSENYATKGRDSIAPNAMWQRRPFAQLAKCAEAQALRKAFPEFGAAPTAEEMEGKEFDPSVVSDQKIVTVDVDKILDHVAACATVDELREKRKAWSALCADARDQAAWKRIGDACAARKAEIEGAAQ